GAFFLAGRIDARRDSDGSLNVLAAANRRWGRAGGRRLHSRPCAARRAALGGGRRGGGDANSALRASNMRRLDSPATPSTSALLKLAPASPAPPPRHIVSSTADLTPPIGQRSLPASIHDGA